MLLEGKVALITGAARGIGRTAALGTVITNGAVTTQHVITLSGLRPGTTYFVKVSSANAAGKSVAPVVLMVTDSRRKNAGTAARPGK